jgi:Protein of unknown function (DUF3108)
VNTALLGRRRLLGWVPLVAALVLSAPLAAQDEVVNRDEQAVLDSLAAEYPTDDFAASVPFGPGERMMYRAEVGWFDVGEAHMSVEATDTVRGNDTYRAVWEIEGSVLGFGVHDILTTFFDTGTLQTWRYLRENNNGSYHGTRRYEMYPEEGIWERPLKEMDSPDRSGALGSSLPLDELSFIYYLRQMELEVGKTYTIPRYFKDDGNPVVIHVLRRELKKVDLGEFNTLVVQPIVQTDGMFGEDGNAEIYITDDERRLVVYLKTNTPGPGDLELYLKGYEPGVPLHPDAREVAAQGRASRAQVDSTQNR